MVLGYVRDLVTFHNNILHSQQTCTVLWHCKVNPCGVWHRCSFSKYEPCGVSQYPSQSVSLTAHSQLSGLMVKPFLCSQHKMVANSLTLWFQSVEKAPTSLYIWIHNIIWIHVIWILIMWIYIIGIHIYHMTLYIWICFVWIHIFSDNIFFIIAWAMSGEHLSPIGSLKYLYLPNGVMMVEWSWLLLSCSNV